MPSNNRLTGQYSLAGAVPSGAFGGSGISTHRQSNDANLEYNSFNTTGYPGGAENSNVFRCVLNRHALVENIVWKLQSAEILRFEESTDQWITEFTLDGASTTNTVCLGLYPFHDQLRDKRYLSTAFQVDGTSSWRGVRYNIKDAVWESGDLFTLSELDFTQGEVSSEVQFNNKIYFTGRVGVGSPGDYYYYSYSPIAMSFEKIYIGEEAKYPMTLGVYQNNLYMLYKDSAGDIKIGRGPGPLQNKINLPYQGGDASATTTTNNFQARCLLFGDNAPSNLTLNAGLPNTPSFYAAYHVDEAGGKDGWEIWRFQGDGLGNLSFIETVGSGNLPASFAAGVAGGGGEPDSIFLLLRDHPAQIVNPYGPAPTADRDRILIRSGGDWYDTYGEYMFEPDRFEDFAAGWPLQSNPGHGMPKLAYHADVIGGGQRYSPAGPGAYPPNAAIFDIAMASGELISDSVLRIHYDLLPSTRYPAGTTVAVRWLFDGSGLPPLDRCYIDATSHGIQRPANTVTNITMQSGVTYYLDWDFTQDGFTKDSRGINLMGLVFISGILPA